MIEKMRTLDAAYWDSVSRRIARSPLEREVALYKKSEHLRLIKEWAGSLEGKKILKTDLFEEALGEDQFLFSLLDETQDVFGMDISPEFAGRAKRAALKSRLDFRKCVVMDVRNCAFADESFDLIISNSTLDHLAAPEVPKALAELRRILKVGGLLILTLDNAHNPMYLAAHFVQKMTGLNKFYLGRCYSVSQAEGLIKKSGFAIEAARPFVAVYPPWTRLLRLLKETRHPWLQRCADLSVQRLYGRSCRKDGFSNSWFIAFKLKRTA